MTLHLSIPIHLYMLPEKLLRKLEEVAKKEFPGDPLAINVAFEKSIKLYIDDAKSNRILNLHEFGSEPFEEEDSNLIRIAKLQDAIKWINEHCKNDPEKNKYIEVFADELIMEVDMRRSTYDIEE